VLECSDRDRPSDLGLGPVLISRPSRSLTYRFSATAFKGDDWFLVLFLFLVFLLVLVLLFGLGLGLGLGLGHGLGLGLGLVVRQMDYPIFLLLFQTSTNDLPISSLPSFTRVRVGMRVKVRVRGEGDRQRQKANSETQESTSEMG
jgi:hypothetical protein